MFELLKAPELYEHLDYPPPPSVEHLQSNYTKLERRRSPDGKQHWLNWVIRKQDAGLVGYVQATVTEGGSAWVAYVLGRNRWGNGYATLATRCMMEHLVAHYAVRRFLATAERSNSRSISVLKRLGFAEAQAEESVRHELTPTELLFVAPAGSATSAP
ncbi:MAG: GNAT family N-acetyltransferase [Myxococcales bacterium]|nr:GNAT family N-acetyltransferase [Myxococcales bacterium]